MFENYDCKLLKALFEYYHNTPLKYLEKFTIQVTQMLNNKLTEVNIN